MKRDPASEHSLQGVQKKVAKRVWGQCWEIIFLDYFGPSRFQVILDHFSQFRSFWVHSGPKIWSPNITLIICKQLFWDALHIPLKSLRMKYGGADLCLRERDMSGRATASQAISHDHAIPSEKNKINGEKLTSAYRMPFVQFS